MNLVRPVGLRKLWLNQNKLTGKIFKLRLSPESQHVLYAFLLPVATLLSASSLLYRMCSLFFISVPSTLIAKNICFNSETLISSLSLGIPCNLAETMKQPIFSQGVLLCCLDPLPNTQDAINTRLEMVRIFAVYSGPSRRKVVGILRLTGIENTIKECQGQPQTYY